MAWTDLLPHGVLRVCGAVHYSFDLEIPAIPQLAIVHAVPIDHKSRPGGPDVLIVLPALLALNH